LVNVEKNLILKYATNLAPKYFPSFNNWMVEIEPDAKNPKLAGGRNLGKHGKKYFEVSILQSLFRKGQIVCCMDCACTAHGIRE